MLFVGLLTFLVAIPLFSYSINTSQFNRMTSLLLLGSALLAFNGYYAESVASGVGIYSGLFQITQISICIETFILVIGSLLLLSWPPISPKKNTTNKQVFIMEYGILILFTIIGASFILSSTDLISIYLSVELQSFSIYILASLYRKSESATSAGLKYFLLGGLSSALLLLGTAIIYSYTGTTQFESLYNITGNLLFSSNPQEFLSPLFLGLLLIGVGFIFKVAAVPFHNWAPDVYDGVPTIVTSWLITIPKISLFLFLLELQIGFSNIDTLYIIENSNNIILQQEGNIWKNLLLVTSLLSLLVGTVVGLNQSKIKRLLAYSTISHVGFILLCLAIQTESSIEAFLFYLIQYSITNVAIFIVLLGFGYSIHSSLIKKISTNINSQNSDNKPNSKKQDTTKILEDINFNKELVGQFKTNPLLSISFAICLFSIAGIPPLIGFFAKQMVLYSSIQSGYYFLSIVAILVSVISTSYYLKIVKILFFEQTISSTNNEKENTKISITSFSSKTITFLFFNNKEEENNNISNIHSLIIAVLTILQTFYLFDPTILLNICRLLTLSLYTT